MHVIPAPQKQIEANKIAMLMLHKKQKWSELHLVFHIRSLWYFYFDTVWYGWCCYPKVGLELALDDLDIRELIMYVWWCFEEEDMGYIHA